MRQLFARIASLGTALHPEVMEPVYGKLNAKRLPANHRLDLRAEYARPRTWGHWKFCMDVLKAYNRNGVVGYEYAPNGKKLIAPPAGYGPHVPVRARTSDGLFPPFGFEVQF
jgi:hypothetical protein